MQAVRRDSGEFDRDERGGRGRLQGRERLRGSAVLSGKLGASSGRDEARGNTMHFFEDARKVGKLFKAEVVSDRFDRFAGDHAGISLGEADLAHPVRDGHVVVRSEAALQGAQRNVAEASQFAGAVI